MTIKDDKNDKNENTAADDTAGADNEKAGKVAEKLKKMGVMPSAKKESKEGGRRVSPMLITLLLAIPAAGLILYYYMPQQINHFISSFTSPSSIIEKQVSTEGSAQVNVNDFQDARQLTIQPVAAKPDPVEVNRWNGMQQPDWVKQQQNQMEKRRAEFAKRNAAYHAANNRPVPAAVEPPQWVKDRRAEMEKQRAAYQQQMEKYQQDMVRQQQEMAKQQQQQWSRQPVNWPYNGSQNQLQQMPSNVANAYPQNQRRFNNTYNHPPQPYYNNRAPYYGYGPRPAPYGWRGYR